MYEVTKTYNVIATDMKVQRLRRFLIEKTMLSDVRISEQILGIIIHILLCLTLHFYAYEWPILMKEI